MFCGSCGKQTSGKKYCIHCGAQIESPDPKPAPETTAVAVREPEKKTGPDMSTVIMAVVTVIVIVCGVALYLDSQPKCDSNSTETTLFRILDEKYLYLEKNGLTDADVAKRLEVITKTSSNDDAKSCSANLILSFPKPIADHLAALAQSKDEPTFSDPQFALLRLYLPRVWNASKAQIEVTISYQYTKDAVMVGGLESLGLVGLDNVMKYVGEIKQSIKAASPNESEVRSPTSTLAPSDGATITPFDSVQLLLDSESRVRGKLISVKGIGVDAADVNDDGSILFEGTGVDVLSCQPLTSRVDNLKTLKEKRLIELIGRVSPKGPTVVDVPAGSQTHPYEQRVLDITECRLR